MNDFFKLRLFANSLTAMAFVWYIHLHVNSIIRGNSSRKYSICKSIELPQTYQWWINQECLSCGEYVEMFITRLKMARNRCIGTLLEAEYVKLALNDMMFDLKMKFSRDAFSDLFELARAMSKC